MTAAGSDANVSVAAVLADASDAEQRSAHVQSQPRQAASVGESRRRKRQHHTTRLGGDISDSEDARTDAALRQCRAHNAAATHALASQQAEERYEREAKQWVQQHRNANTSAAYAGAWRRFEQWAREVETPRRDGAAVDTKRPRAHDIALYMRYMHEAQDAKAGTREQALAAIADRLAYERDKDASYDPCNSRLVQSTMAVLLPLSRPVQQKAALTPQQQEEVIETIWEHPDEAPQWMLLRDALLLQLAWHAMMRTSEIARMTCADVQEVDATTSTTGRSKALRVWINPLSKNDSRRKGHERLVAQSTGSKAHNERHCPVLLLRQYSLAKQEAGVRSGAKDPLFPTVTGSFMSADTPRGRLKRWLARTPSLQGADISQYGFHSLRSGAATAAASAGVSTRLIMQQGNWRSTVVEGYIRPNNTERLTVSTALGSTPSRKRRGAR